jgi:thimet oligopeptidase
MSKPSRALRVHLLLFASAGALFLGLGAPVGFGARAASAAPKDPAGMKAEVQAHLDQAQKILDGILAVKDARTVENSLNPMNDLSLELADAANLASLMENVHPDAEVRGAAEKANQDVQAFVTALSLNRAVYDAVKSVDVSKADAITKRLHERTLRDYRRAGVDKDEATRQKIQALKEELVTLGQEFDRNIREGTRSISLRSVDELAGLPEDYIASHPPDSTGAIVITTRYPDYIPFMTYARNGEARKRLYTEYQNRAYPANRETLGKILAKRYELATTLGYKNWADYVTEDKMIKSASKVSDFVEQLKKAAADRA